MLSLLLLHNPKVFDQEFDLGHKPPVGERYMLTPSNQPGAGNIVVQELDNSLRTLKLEINFEDYSTITLFLVPGERKTLNYATSHVEDKNSLSGTPPTPTAFIYMYRFTIWWKYETRECVRHVVLYARSHVEKTKLMRKVRP